MLHGSGDAGKQKRGKASAALSQSGSTARAAEDVASQRVAHGNDLLLDVSFVEAGRIDGLE